MSLPVSDEYWWHKLGEIRDLKDLAWSWQNLYGDATTMTEPMVSVKRHLRVIYLNLGKYNR